MLGFAALGVAVASAIFNIIGLAIPYWLYRSDSGVKYYLGLWESCGSALGETACVSYGSDSDALKGVRACELLGMLLILGTVLCFIMKLFVMKDRAMLPKIGSGLAIASGIFMIIGCIVFAEHDDFKVMKTVLSLDLHAGFALCIIGGILAIIAAVLGFMIRTDIYTA